MKLTALFLCCLPVIQCSAGDSANREVPITSLKTLDIKCRRLSDVIEMKRAIKLETPDNGVVGTASKIITLPSGDFLVGDFDMVNAVLQFTSHGKFVRRLSRQGQGPGEYITLRDFTSDPLGNIYVLDSMKLMKFSPGGVLLKETRLPFHAKDIQWCGQRLWIYTLKYAGATTQKNQIIILDEELVLRGGTGELDSRLERYRYLPDNHSAVTGSTFYYTDVYEFGFTACDSTNMKTVHYGDWAANRRLDSVWLKKKLSEDDKRMIKKQLRRFSSIFAVGSSLVLLEIQAASSGYYVWVTDPVAGSAVRMPYFMGICRNVLVENPGDLYFDWLAGGCPEGVIGVFANAGEFNKYKTNYPLLAHLDYSLDDNPILVIFDFKLPKHE